MKLETVAGQPSWKLSARGVQAWITRLGGHLGPVHFRLGAAQARPLSVNDWPKDKAFSSLPAIVQALRGDFFCLPFGLNLRAWRGERYAVHGETANQRWLVESAGRTREGFEFRSRLRTTTRRGLVRKTIRLVDGHSAVYCRHVIEGMAGPMCFGHHAMLRFPPGEGTGLVATSPFRFGQVYPGAFEDAAQGGYFALRPGARFRSLARVPDRFGGSADLSRYPARPGYDDLVMLVAAPRRSVAWSAVTFPGQNYVWFALKDPAVLRQTVMWHSNGGRHYYPWNGLHRHVLGLEEITGHFHSGLKESAEPNALSRAGIPTSHVFRPDVPLTVNYIMAVARIPKSFDHVADIALADGRARLTSRSGKSVQIPLDAGFLHEDGAKR